MQIRTTILLRVRISLLFLVVGFILHAQDDRFESFFSQIDHQMESQPSKVVEAIDSLIKLNPTLSPNISTRLYHLKSDAYYFLNDLKKSTQSLQSALHIMPENYDLSLQAEMYNSYGQNLDAIGQRKKASESYQQGLKIAKVISDSIQMSNLYYNLGLIQFFQRNLIEAHNYFDSCQIIYLSLNDSTGISELLRVQASLSAEFQDYERSIEYSKKGILYANQINKSSTCLHYLDISNAFIAMKDRDSSLFYISLAQKKLPQANSEIESLELLKTYGNYYAMMKDSAKAITYFDSLIVHSQKLGAVESYYHGILSRLTYDVNSLNLDRAVEVVKEADSLGFKRLCNIAYSLVAKKLHKAGRDEEAYRALSRSQDLQDQIINEKNSSRVQLQNSRFSIKEKEIEARLAKEKLKTRQAQFTNYAILGLGMFIGLIGWLFYRNKKEKFRLQNERIRNEAKLQNELSEIESKAFRAQMNPHFVFNALNSIKGLIVNNRDKEAARYISKFSKLLRSVLDNSKMKTICLSDDLEVLEMYLNLEQMRFRDGFEYEIITDSDLDLDNLLIPPSLIQPFVENAIWHGFKNNVRQNKIDIYINDLDEELQIIIQDNGIGRQESQKQKTTNKHQSHGIQITKQRIFNFSQDKEESRLQFFDLDQDNQKSDGTKVVIRIPMKYK